MYILHFDLQLYPLRMWLGPDEHGVNQSHFGQPTKPAQTQRHQLLALQSAGHPVLWWLQPPLAAVAEVYRRLPLDSLRDVDVQTNAILTHGHASVARHGHATCCAEDAGSSAVSGIPQSLVSDEG